MSMSSSMIEEQVHRRAGAVERNGSSVQRHAAYFGWKVAIDLAVAYLLLVPVSAAIVILVLLVRATSRGPGIFRQVRVGKDGRHFMMYKIRTMRVDAEAASGPVWTQPHDPRVTFMGRLLRKLHLDELPQLYNVLRGEMSFVGPRPERPEFVPILSQALPGYRNRLVVRPGITGLAQLNLPPDSDLLSVRRKLVLDCEYVRTAGLWLDCRLVACTAARMLRLTLLGVLGLRRDVLLLEHAEPEALDLPPGGLAALHAAHANGNGTVPLKSAAGEGTMMAGWKSPGSNRPR
jgi:lipopolysaccharide/colanic/teichoic acid biosynthesis glycosyltransferase